MVISFKMYMYEASPGTIKVFRRINFNNYNSDCDLCDYEREFSLCISIMP
jgi:hypothetical protein